MATSRILFNPSECAYDIRMKIGQNEVMLADSPKQFIADIYHQIAIQTAQKIMDRLAPAIDKALEEIKLEAQPPAGDRK